MATRVGIMGLGFMGMTHFDTYARIKGAKVVAICDVDPKKLAGDWSSIAGNIGGPGARRDLSGIRTYSRARDLYADPDVDVIDVTLPTDRHMATTIAALKAGKHVICEKPMARTGSQCLRMIEAARKARRRLFVAHCIRYWPDYAKTRDIVRSGRHGKVLSAIFTRLSATPTWGYQNWILNAKSSGAAALDLHIHDADFVLYTFGKPKTVTSHGAGFRRGRVDHIVTSYQYPGNKLVVAEGAWEYHPTFPFTMSFRIMMEKATLTFDTNGLMLHTAGAKSRPIKVKAGDGYEHELRDFVNCIAKNRKSDVVSLKSAMQAVKLCEAEIRSATSGRTVAAKL